MADKHNSGKKTSIGGQALIEGIMMRGPKITAMAVRNPQNEIILEKWETQTSGKSKIRKMPIIRGVFNFIDSMLFGYKCLMRSAEIAGLEEEKPEKNGDVGASKISGSDRSETATQMSEAAGPETSATESASVAGDAEVQSVQTDADNSPASCSETERESTQTNSIPESNKSDEKEEKKDSTHAVFGVIMVIASIIGVALAILLFVMLPSYIYTWLTKALPVLKPDNAALASLIKSVFEGVLKIAVLVAYMALVTLMKDIRRTFMYHGAEHKTIFCYEHGKELTVENVRGERRFHPRCGTSFLILMLLVGMFISFFIDPLFIWIRGSVPPTLIRVLIKILLIPLIVGIGYELIKLAGRRDNLFTRIISAPGMWLQHITVLEPSDDMIECAIKAFREVVPDDGSDNY